MNNFLKKPILVKKNTCDCFNFKFGDFFIKLSVKLIFFDFTKSNSLLQPEHKVLKAYELLFLSHFPKYSLKPQMVFQNILHQYCQNNRYIVFLINFILFKTLLILKLQRVFQIINGTQLTHFFITRQFIKGVSLLWFWIYDSPVFFCYWTVVCYYAWIYSVGFK